MSPVILIDRVDGFQRRHTVLGFPIAVGYKFFEDAGMHLVATLAYYALISSFPMALLTSAVVAGIIAIWPDAREPLSYSLLVHVPLVRGQITGSSGTYGGTLGLVVGALGSLYGGLGVANGFQHAMNQVWAVPRNGRPNPFFSRVRSLALLTLLLGSVIVSSIMAGSGPRPSAVATPTATSTPIWPITIFAVNVMLMVMAFRYATAGGVSTRQILPGAVIAGLCWPAFQVKAMSALRDADTGTAKGVALAILGLVALLHLAALVVVLCAELNAVLAKRLWPRALLTPFTDNVDLTEADRASYAAQARAQRFKAYQAIDVTFGSRSRPENPPPRS